ncbi:OmpA family protein [Sporosalibacterium faouarense]|uniref:OmpA family protein n=1 Tax=Sporosalibacterium faouarense TaxID=516123 RepID=UPI00192C6783|nr:OmpA family protein [Sporosalibacterium faouarense]
MPRKYRKTLDIEDPSTNNWMTTYGDMVTLLLTFFILLFSISEVNSQKFRAIVNSFQGSPGILKSGSSVFDSRNDDAITNQEIENSFVELKNVLENYLKVKNVDSKILVELDQSGLILRFQDNVLFSSGKANIKTESKLVLLDISDILVKEAFKKYNIRVEGHTDSVPTLTTSKYPTNWDLSVARASNVVKFLIEEAGLTPSRLSAAGFSEYKPIAPNDTIDGKQKNRRVDIVILRSE